MTRYVQRRRHALSTPAVLMLILAGAIGEASAQESANVALCDGCTSDQMQEKAKTASNLIYTSSHSPVQVDYSSYERPGARNAPDYNRGIGWLNSHGLLIVRPNGGIGVRSGTVIVGSVVTVQQ